MSFHELFSQSTQVRIPLFQREYVWTEKQLNRLTNEIRVVVEGEDTNRFLGAIIAVRREANPAAPQPYEIVDGQQRLTTLFLFVLAAAYVAAKSGQEDYAIGLINSNLAIDWWRDGPNTKLISSYADQSQFVSAFSQLLKLGNLSDLLGPRIKFPAATGPSTGRLLNQFTRIQKFLTTELANHGFEHFKNLVTTAQTKLTFVFILLKDASNATTVFEGLNDPGVPIGIGDLVRNEVFSKIADNPDVAHHIHEQLWLPFRNKLGIYFDQYFFPFGVLQDSSTRQVDLFKSLRELWKAADRPAEIIAHLEEYVEPYLALASDHYDGPLNPRIATSISNLKACNLPNSTYPFIMRLLKEVEKGKVSVDDAVSCLEAIESFLVRRAIVGIESSGLLVFFRTAWSVMGGTPNWTAFADALKRREGIEWPDDDRIRAAVLARRIYKIGIKNYLLAEYDRSLGGDVPNNPAWIEHVLPQSMSEDWHRTPDGFPLFNKEAHDELLDTWGNLVCLSSRMNIDVSNAAYRIKRAIFQQSSMYKSARALAERYETWTPDTVRERSAEIGEWAIKRWKRDL